MKTISKIIAKKWIGRIFQIIMPATNSNYFMRAFLIILTISISITCFGQTKSEMEKVIKFRNDLLTDVEMYKKDTIYTSYAMIVRKRLPNLRSITTYPKDRKIKEVEYYYNDTKILESNYTYKLPGGELTGITKQYNEKGQLEYIQDHDQGTWEVVKFDNYPYYKTLQKMKLKSDSLIISTYGDLFYRKYLVWYPESSAFYDGKYAGATWYDYQEWEPKEFKLGYSIKFSENESYEEQIVVSLIV